MKMLESKVKSKLNQSISSQRKKSESVKGFHSEMNLLRKEIVAENLEREKRKLEWKKLNVLTKEQIH